MTTAKLIVFWVLGGGFALFGSWILNNLKQTVGVSETGYIFALVIAFACFLITGLFWISVAVASKH